MEGIGGSPLVCRYIDWLITVPLQVVEFYLIMAAIGAATFAMFRNLMAASIVMLVAGFFGESDAWDLFGWNRALRSGGSSVWQDGFTSSTHSGLEMSKRHQSPPAMACSSFTSMRWIVSVRWHPAQSDT